MLSLFYNNVITNFSMQEIIQREYPQKLYVQLYEILKKKIEEKEWNVGFQVPTEEELCKTYGVSRATVRSAILELVRQGYLKRQQGKGTFVCRKVITYELTMLTSFRELMLEPGVRFSTKVLAQTVIMPVDDLPEKLNVSPDKHLIYIKRITVIDNKPIIIQEIYVPFHICPQLLEEDLEKSSLVELSKKYEIKITRIRNYFDIAYLNAEEGRLLEMTEGTPALLLNQSFYSGETQIMYIRSVKRSDRFKFSIEFVKNHAETSVNRPITGWKGTNILFGIAPFKE
jgi:GntR family transcriptional regulator